MAEFLFIYRGGEEGHAKLSPEEMQRQMEKWGTWIGEALQKGWMLNPGDALTREGKVVHANKTITDGPFAESKEVLGGYSIVTAESLAAAAELAKGCPGLLVGGKVEVRPLAGMKV